MDSMMLVLLLICLVLVAGCMGGGPSESAPTAVPSGPSVTQPTDSGPEQAIGDATVPFIQENDTVEIGEML